MGIEDVGELTRPVMLAAFEGWNDAGDAASGVVAFLQSALDADLIDELDPEEYYDFQVNRPHIRLDERGVRELVWPTTRVFLVRGARDLVLVHGIEPSMRWKSFAADMLAVALDLGIESVFFLGALLADTPHTRPVPVNGTSSDAGVSARLGLEPNRYEGPTGIVGVLVDLFSRSGIETTTIWAAVPQYLAAPPNPKASLALLRAIAPELGMSVPMDPLEAEAEAWQRGADEYAAEDEEVAEYVAALEQERDAAVLEEASGDEIAAQFERYLRGREQ